jgi:hypothetical protein
VAQADYNTLDLSNVWQLQAIGIKEPANVQAKKAL